jgi:deoxyxylulose-5-phosphate synthase
MNHYPAGPHLSRIETPSDLREHFNIEDLPAVCDELRDFIVEKRGGILELVWVWLN